MKRVRHSIDVDPIHWMRIKQAAYDRRLRISDITHEAFERYFGAPMQETGAAVWLMLALGCAACFSVGVLIGIVAT